MDTKQSKAILITSSDLERLEVGWDGYIFLIHQEYKTSNNFGHGTTDNIAITPDQAGKIANFITDIIK